MSNEFEKKLIELIDNYLDRGLVVNIYWDGEALASDISDGFGDVGEAIEEGLHECAKNIGEMVPAILAIEDEYQQSGETKFFHPLSAIADALYKLKENDEK